VVGRPSGPRQLREAAGAHGQPGGGAQGDVARREVEWASGPVRLIGSSMGGYLAALVAARDPRVEALVLMAPAFDIQAGWRARYGEAKLAEWRRLGARPTFHYAHGTERPIGYGLYEDMGRHDPRPRISVPALVFIGRRDDVVDPAAVEAVANRRRLIRQRGLAGGKRAPGIPRDLT